MKELSIEQKAIAYDKVIEKLRDFYRDYDTISHLIDVKEELANLFPELKGSNNKEIREDIINNLKRYINCIKDSYDAHSAKNLVVKEIEKQIAWLEKQDDKPQGKTALEVIKEEKVDNQKCVKSVDDVEQKIDNKIEIPFGAKDSELQEETYFIPKGFHAEIDDDKVVIKKGEKPAAWSKKDEKMFEYALNMIEWYSGKNEDKSRYVSDWLKSIKQRIGG